MKRERKVRISELQEKILTLLRENVWDGFHAEYFKQQFMDEESVTFSDLSYAINELIRRGLAGVTFNPTRYRTPAHFSLCATARQNPKDCDSMCFAPIRKVLVNKQTIQSLLEQHFSEIPVLRELFFHGNESAKRNCVDYVMIETKGCADRATIKKVLNTMLSS